MKRREQAVYVGESATITFVGELLVRRVHVPCFYRRLEPGHVHPFRGGQGELSGVTAKKGSRS